MGNRVNQCIYIIISLIIYVIFTVSQTYGQISQTTTENKKDKVNPEWLEKLNLTDRCWADASIGYAHRLLQLICSGI